MDKKAVANLARQLKSGKIGVMPTDTIYGIVCTIDNKTGIERIYRLKARTQSKPFVCLISDTPQLADFGIELNTAQRAALKKLWPGPYSVILPAIAPKLDYIHRGHESIAVRLPKLPWLRELINMTGPIVATSANLSGKQYIGSTDLFKKDLPGLDFYIEGADTGTASQLATLDEDGKINFISRN